MYSSGYSHVSKYSPQARKKMKQHSKGKSCGYYMRIVFFFSSLIQSLIIVSLVLFLIYGKDQDSASMTRIHDLEESHSRLSIENVALRQQRKNLTTFLNATLIEKARNDWDLAKLRDYTNDSIILIKDMEMRLTQCTRELMMNKLRCAPNPCPVSANNQCNCGFLVDQLKAKLQLEESNFTQTVQRMRMDMEQTDKERDKVILEAIHLRREKSTHEKELEYFRQKCKDDFTQSLSGVSSVSKAFLEKIDSLFPSHIAFQLTCDKQTEHLEQIRTNCSSLSREVEDRFQRYLNSVGDQVSSIQAESSRMKAENWRLSEDYRWCSQNRTGLIQQNSQNQEKLQLKHDQEKEKLLMDKMKLHGEIEVLENNVNYKSKEVEHLFEQIKLINMSCMSKTGLNTFQGSTLQGGGPNLFNKPASGSGSSSSTGSFGSAFNKPLLNGAGSFSSSGSSLPGSRSSTGFGSSKPASTGSGSSSSSLFGSSSSTGFGSNKPASSGSGSSSSSSSSLPGSSSSTGFGSSKPASTGSGSSSSSLFGSSSSTGLGSNKPASTGSGSSSSSGSSFFGQKSTSGFGSSKPASTGSGSSSSSLFGSSSSTGLGSNKPASTGLGSSSSSSSSLFGSSRSTGLGFNKPASTGSGSSSSSLFGSSSSTGLGSNKPASTGGLFSSSSSSSSGRGSSPSGSSPNLSIGGLGSNNPSSTGKSSSGFGSSSAGSSTSSGSTSKSSSSSSGLGWFGFGGSSSGQSKTGSGTGKETSGGSGSSFGSGTTGRFGGGSVNVAQHLKNLQRLINPAVPEEKQDLSRMLG